MGKITTLLTAGAVAALAARSTAGALEEPDEVSVESAASGGPAAEPLPPEVADAASPAFYEVALSPGWAILTNDGASRAVEIGAEGDGPATRLANGAKRGVARVFRLDTAVYVAADSARRAVTQSAPISRMTDQAERPCWYPSAPTRRSPAIRTGDAIGSASRGSWET